MKSYEIFIKVRVVAVEVLANPNRRWWQIWKSKTIERPFSAHELSGFR